MVTQELKPEDIKWLQLVRANEMYNRKHRPMPIAVQTRLRSLGLIEIRARKPVLTAAGQRALKEAQD